MDKAQQIVKQHITDVKNTEEELKKAAINYARAIEAKNASNVPEGFKRRI